MDIELLQQYIDNPEKHFNDPDDINFFGEQISCMRNLNAYPFSYVQLPGTTEPVLIIGEPGTYHDKIRDKIINNYREKTNNNFQALNKIFGGYILKEYLGQMKRPKANQEECIERGIKYGGREWLEQHEQNGRYFLLSKDDVTVCIFGFWSIFHDETDEEDTYESPDSASIGKLVRIVMAHDQRISQCDLILIANNDQPYYVYQDDVVDDFFSVGDNSAQRAIHLANQREKRDFFADFRNNRDRMIGKKLTMDNGEEMPLAQYNSLRYVDESKNEPKRIFITESQLYSVLSEKKKLYSLKDKLELVRAKNIKDGGNFPIKRNGKVYWISRSMTVGVYVYCQDENGVVYTLASKRGPHVHTQQNLWNAPCGYLDYGDSVKETAVKECWEETGVKIPMEKLVYLGENSEISRNSDVKYTFYCVLDGVISEYPTSMANCEPGEVTDVRWIPLEEVNKYPFVGQQAKHLYDVGSKLFKNRSIYQTDEDYAAIIAKLQSMLSKGIIDDKQFERIKNSLNI